MGENENLSIDFSELKYLERQLHNLSRLVEINGIINSTLDIAKLLTLVMEIIKEIMDTEASTLPSTRRTRANSFSGRGEAGRAPGRYRVGEGRDAGWVATLYAVYINDAYSDERFDPSFDADGIYHTLDAVRPCSSGDVSSRVIQAIVAKPAGVRR